MSGKRMRKSELSDGFVLAAATTGMVLWSLLARDGRTSLIGLGAAAWFPVSVVLYRIVLRWMPVIGGLYGRPVQPGPQRRREIIAGCLLTASFSIVFLGCMPGQVAVADMVALNFACLAALLDRSERWMPTHILIPMLLLGLMNGIWKGNADNAVLGAAAAWGCTLLVLVFIAVSARVSVLSSDDVTLAAACGAWVGIGGLSTFLLLTGFLYWVSCMLARYSSTSRAEGAGRHRSETIWIRSTGLSFAVSLAVTMLLRDGGQILPG
ncbi:prepilin peptidase [Gluconacetobacter takamatsuzukensis]|uniref:Prepilin peptidase n=1 Tax=Gluconacetobacter takamatsuzukensis TaxID=1286190 RepID=A0A7W4KAW9_9PROT|nr:A24 family peptidase [Gluconacetobacter takamatsuzukensis]MBB2203566.1 prepilin peptidase [Gluconacetobacter takamatsuzukensis]